MSHASAAPGPGREPGSRPSFLFHSLAAATHTAHPGRAGATAAASGLAHAVLVAAVAVVPLLVEDALPGPAGSATYIAPPLQLDAPPLPPPPPPPGPRPALRPAPRVAEAPRAGLTVPVSVPDVIRPEESLGLDFSGGQEGGVPGGVPDGVVGGIVGGLPHSALSSAPPPPPVRPGGDIRRPVKVRDVRPEYPDLALKARVEGTVILECTISAEGRVSEVRVLRGVPLLDDAAVEAVRRWVYTPTLLNGVPVPVVMTVTVDFNLRGGG